MHVFRLQAVWKLLRQETAGDKGFVFKETLLCTEEVRERYNREPKET